MALPRRPTIMLRLSAYPTKRTIDSIGLWIYGVHLQPQETCRCDHDGHLRGYNKLRVTAYAAHGGKKSDRTVAAGNCLCNSSASPQARHAVPAGRKKSCRANIKHARIPLTSSDLELFCKMVLLVPIRHRHLRGYNKLRVTAYAALGGTSGFFYQREK